MQEDLVDIDNKIKTIENEIGILIQKKKKLSALREKIKSNIHEKMSATIANKDWKREDYSWSDDLKLVLKNTFKIDALRPHQLPTMNATLSGTDCILIMPTGGGKSLCYQLPALVSKGVTIVVSPLISLMEDQLMSLKKLNIEARMLSATSPREEVNWVHNAMTDSNSPLKLLYVTPEKLSKSKRFMSKLQKMFELKRFARLAIDEVHCCSQWGHDFRPDYKFLGIMRQMFSGVPILGLTATATSRVIRDVQKILNIQGCLVLKASFNRPNLFYEVRLKPSVRKDCITQLVDILKKDFRDQSGIIYTMTIKDTEELSKDLREAGIKVAPYHAQLEADLRSKIHRKWISNHYQAVVATIAFGMGIDKPDVRFVIHHCISKSMENFYQESGRAGRDDKPAKCILFWRFNDMFRQSTMVFTENTGIDNLYGIVSYCIDSHRCRRKMIAEHFDEAWEMQDCNRMCDHCCKHLSTKTVDISSHGTNLINILKKASSLDTKLTATKLVDIWLGKGPTQLRIKEAIASGMNRENAELIVAHLIIDGFLKEDFHFTPYTTISYITQGNKADAGLPPSPIDMAEMSNENNLKKQSKKSSRKRTQSSDSSDEDFLIERKTAKKNMSSDSE